MLLGATFENNGEVNNNNLYELKTNEETNDRSKLINFVTVLNSYSGEDLKTRIEAIFDVETYLRQMAVETLVVIGMATRLIPIIFTYTKTPLPIKSISFLTISTILLALTGSAATGEPAM